MKMIIPLLLVFQLAFAPLAFAARPTNPGLSLSDEITSAVTGHEYVSGAAPGAVLMKVNLWGGVQKAGIHHVPPRTDLLTLLSYAGGPSADADLDDVTVRRQVGDKIEQIDVDVDKLLSSSKMANFVLEPNDVVVIRAHKPLIGPNTVTAVTVLASVASIILASIIIRDRTR